MGDIYTNPPQSRNEAILRATIDGTEYTAPPQSRIEDLLLELKEAIEQGGGTGEGDMKKSVYDSDNAVATAGGIAEYVDDEITDLHLGTASTKNSTSVVTDSSDLVESGAVKDIVGWGNKNFNNTEYKNYNYNGVIWTVNLDGSVKANGTTDSSNTSQNGMLSLDTLYNSTPWVCKETGQYIANGCSNPNDKISMYLWNDEDNARPYADSSKTTRITGDIYNNAEASFYAEAGKKYRLLLRVKSNTQADNFVFYPMIRRADITDATYEPYHASVSESLAGKADNTVIGTVEDGTNPTKAYAVNEFMVRDGSFCQVTAPVTTSSTWTEGSNYTKKSIAEVLQSLMS